MMASAAEMGGKQPSLAYIECAMRGWNSPRPISIRLPSSETTTLRESIRCNLAALIPRCEQLERSLSDDMRRHRAYVASKIHQESSLDMEPDEATSGSGIPRLHEPEPRKRLDRVNDAGTPLPEWLARDRPLLAIGDVADQELHNLLAEQEAVHVRSGDGDARITPSGRRRPGGDSFSTWMAEHDETERATPGTFVLSRAAGRADVDLLRHRLYAHQRVLVEAGSAALTWLLAQWDGTVVRHGNVFAFAGPGDMFREPSARARLSPDADWPRISVVTISYNQRDYLEQCIRSVLDQGYPNLEFIVIDANSNDGSIDIPRRYEAEFAILVIEPDEGQSSGLNKGFNLATGDILTWVNSDDMLAPLALKRAALAFAKTGADLVAGTCSRVAGVEAKLLYRHHSALPTGRLVDFDLSGPLDWCGAWEKSDYFFQPEVFFTRDMWNRAGGYLKPHLYWAMDWDLWLRCALAGATVIRIPDVLGISRTHQAQKTKSDEMYLWQITNILREYDDLLVGLARDAVIA